MRNAVTACEACSRASPARPTDSSNSARSKRTGAKPAAVPRDDLLGPVEVRERGRNVTATALHEAQVLGDDPDREITAEVARQPLRLHQIPHREPEVLAFGLHDAPVDEVPLHGQLLAAPAQRAVGGLIVGEGVVEPAEVVEDHGALASGARTQQRNGQVHLVQRRRGSPLLHERERELHPALGRRLARAQPDRATQVRDRLADLAGLAQRVAPRLLGQRQGGDVVARIPHDLCRQRDRPDRVDVGEPHRFARRV